MLSLGERASPLCESLNRCEMTREALERNLINAKTGHEVKSSVTDVISECDLAAPSINNT
jgi:hypothetical protein